MTERTYHLHVTRVHTYAVTASSEDEALEVHLEDRSVELDSVTLHIEVVVADDGDTERPTLKDA